MNEKFFDLKKEKQDRMINAALRAFGENGYKRASTDEIVAGAGISKGLLFHYFINKLGLYTFLYEYSVKFLSLELSAFVDKEETNYFELMRQKEKAICQILKNYPYMKLFIDRTMSEDVPEALEATNEQKEAYREMERAITEQADLSAFSPNADAEKVMSLVLFAERELMRGNGGEFSPEIFYGEFCGYLNMLEKLCIR